MKKLAPYLAFSGKCEEALKFYKQAIGGEILSLSRYGDSPVKVPANFKNKVMHAEFKAEEVFFMAADMTPEHPIQNGNSISLSLNLSDVKELDATFLKLSKGGQVIMPLAEQFWGARFGMLVDKFGIVWMLNCEKIEIKPKTSATKKTTPPPIKKAPVKKKVTTAAKGKTKS